ncbi:6,7-dimethyl-8-ribityllumazine synthase [Candidatus Planktophila vernalis]|uniref:6,7-dimethyl-8-ribityllumazine synthase n=1 Tax=Candidatus Planktophila vernalis TaxID=1884907 RepID=A0A249KTN1_9ACTN|nr:6,7-dimethyl-8-ribityllumazine synthase [Candidatus Planktophila vernalis]ASY20134.1 6,7-dimethyl-8-ribityllumazine synthase [Candidatus Planktophila vernalis]
MAGHAPTIGIKPLPGAKVAIISSSWHLDICNDLIAGAKRALTQAQVGTVEVQFVPGSFEIPLAAQYAFEAGFDAVVALGLVLKGETPHFEYVCQGVTQGVIDVSLKHSKPIGYGVLMCNDLDQAIDRCGRATSKEDKGYDSAVAALELLHLQKKR